MWVYCVILQWGLCVCLQYWCWFLFAALPTMSRRRGSLCWLYFLSYRVWIAWCYCQGQSRSLLIIRAHSFPRAAEFGRCRGISVFLRNFTEFCINTKIPRQRPSSVRLYCCCNCDTQSLWTATQSCWFQWRVFTFSFYLLDLCRWRWLVIETDWLARSTDEWRRFFGSLPIFFIKA